MKGSSSDIPFIVVGVFILGIALFTSYAVMDNYSDVMQPVLGNLTAQGINTTISNETIATGIETYDIWDSSIVFAVIMSIVATGISAFFLKTHPMFFILSLIIWVISFVIGAIFSNTFGEIASNAVFFPITAVLTNTVTLNLNQPILVAIIGAIIILALYAKRGGRNETRAF